MWPDKSDRFQPAADPKSWRFIRNVDVRVLAESAPDSARVSPYIDSAGCESLDFARCPGYDPGLRVSRRLAVNQTKTSKKRVY